MTDRQTLDVYNASVKQYTETEMTDLHQQALEDFIPRVRRVGRVLDLGCGPGLHARQMMAAKLVVDAVDATPGFIAAAQRRGVSARLATFEDVPGPKDRYHGIWASFSLLHAPRASVAGHVARIAKALAPEGPFFLGMKLGTGEERDGIGRFYCYFSEAELRDMHENAGLRVDRSVTGVGKGLAGSDDAYALLTAVKDA